MFFEWDGATLTSEPAPGDSDDVAPFQGSMIVLPTGQVLYTDYTKNVEVFTPNSGTYQAAWRPTINSVASTPYTSSTNNAISGTQFNGLSQGSMYGDDEHVAENFPLVYLKNLSSGHVFCRRTHAFSTMAVATGSASSSASPPATTPPRSARVQAGGGR